MWKCKYCSNEFNFESFGNKVANHSRWCKKNPKYELYLKCLENLRKKINRSSVWNKGLTKNSDNRVKKQGERLSHRHKIGELTGSFLNKHHTEETKEKIRIAQLNAIKNGKKIVCGRAPKINYSSSIAGEFQVDGSWEYKFCHWADKNGLSYERNKIGIKYINLSGAQSTYFPDFKLKNENTFIEIKGYQTKLDNCKWSQFPYKLLILKSEFINNTGSIGINDLNNFIYSYKSNN